MSNDCIDPVWYLVINSSKLDELVLSYRDNGDIQSNMKVPKPWELRMDFSRGKYVPHKWMIILAL